MSKKPIKRGTKKPVKQRPRTATKKTKRTRAAKIAGLAPLTGEEASAHSKFMKDKMFVSDHLKRKGKKNAKELFNTSIPELRSLPISKAESDCIDATMESERKNFPYASGGVAIRYRVEIAASFLCMVIDHAYGAAEANKMKHPDVYAQVMIDLAIARAKEIWGQGGT